MTSQTFFLIFIPILAIILLAIYLTFTSKVSAFFKANAYKFCMLITFFLTVSLPMKILLASLNMEYLMPVWAGLYACLLLIVTACLNGKNLPEALMFVTAFSITTTIVFIFMLIQPQLILSLKEIDAIFPFLGLCSYLLYSSMAIDVDTGTNSIDPSEMKMNKADSAGEGSSKNPGKGKGKGKGQIPLTNKSGNNFKQAIEEDISSESDIENARNKLKNVDVQFNKNGKITMGDKNLSNDPNFIKINKYSLPIDTTSQQGDVSNNPIQDVATLEEAKQELKSLQKKIHRQVEGLIKQHYRVGKSVRQSTGIPVLPGYVLQASNFDSTMKIDMELTQERLNYIFELSEKKHQLYKAVQSSPLSPKIINNGVLAQSDLKDLTNVSAAIAVHNDTYNKNS